MHERLGERARRAARIFLPGLPSPAGLPRSVTVRSHGRP
ncbi:hypothetical protein WCP94_001789 [Bilophila wadsworthia]